MRTEHYTIKPTLKRNELHFEVQRSTKGAIFRNRKTYTRKLKHKLAWDF